MISAFSCCSCVMLRCATCSSSQSRRQLLYADTSFGLRRYAPACLINRRLRVTSNHVPCHADQARAMDWLRSRFTPSCCRCATRFSFSASSSWAIASLLVRSALSRLSSSRVRTSSASSVARAFASFAAIDRAAFSSSRRRSTSVLMALTSSLSPSRSSTTDRIPSASATVQASPIEAE